MYSGATRLFRFFPRPCPRKIRISRLDDASESRRRPTTRRRGLSLSPRPLLHVCDASLFPVLSHSNNRTQFQIRSPPKCRHLHIACSRSLSLCVTSHILPRDYISSRDEPLSSIDARAERSVRIITRANELICRSGSEGASHVVSQFPIKFQCNKYSCTIVRVAGDLSSRPFRSKGQPDRRL